MDFDHEELAKAAANLERLRLFFAPRSSWTVPPDGADHLADFARALRATGTEVSRVLAREDKLPASIDSPPAPAPAAPGTFDPDQLEKFARFAVQLQQWFTAHAAARPGRAQGELQKVHRTLVLVDRALVPLVGAPVTDPWDEVMEETDGEIITSHEPSGAQVPVMAAGPAARAATLGNTSSRERVTASQPAAQRIQGLVLDPEGEVALLHERGDQVELTDAARDILTEFFEGQGLDLSSSERRNFERKVLRWVETIPVGQVLIVKITDLNGRPEPYARFQPRLASSAE